MRISYDPRYDVAYIAFREGDDQLETVAVGEFVNVDLAEDGTVFGIELLNAGEQLSLGPGAKIVVYNESDGTVVETALPA